MLLWRKPCYSGSNLCSVCLLSAALGACTLLGTHSTNVPASMLSTTCQYKLRNAFMRTVRCCMSYSLLTCNGVIVAKRAPLVCISFEQRHRCANMEIESFAMSIIPWCVASQLMTIVKVSVLAVFRCCSDCHRTCQGMNVALKIASIGSSKHHSLKHQLMCLLALRSLWGQCVPHVMLAGDLTSMQHGYGLGTALVPGRHPKSGMCMHK